MLGGSLSRVGDAANGSGDGGSSGGGSSGGSGSRVNDKPWAIMFARLKRPSATSRVRVHGSSSCREKKKERRIGGARCRSRLQPRAAARENKKENSDEPRRRSPLSLSLFFSLSISLSFSFPFFSPSPPLSHQSSRDGFSPNAGRNTEASFTNECHLTIRSAG